MKTTIGNIGVEIERVFPDDESFDLYDVVLTHEGRWNAVREALTWAVPPDIYVPYAAAEPLRGLVRDTMGAYMSDPREDAKALVACDCLCSALLVKRFDWDSGEPDVGVMYYGYYRAGFWRGLWEALLHGRLSYALVLTGKDVREVFAPIFNSTGLESCSTPN